MDFTGNIFDRSRYHDTRSFEVFIVLCEFARNFELTFEAKFLD